MQDSFMRIEKPNLRATVVQQIEDLIRDGRLEPRAKLPPERELQQKLNVSRPLLREALHELTIIGLIEVRHGQGRYVADSAGHKLLSRPLSQYLLRGEITIGELQQTRKIIEGEIAGLAADAATPADIVELSALLRTMEATCDDQDSCVTYDTAFHAKIAAVAGNRLLERILASMNSLLNEYRRVLVVNVPERITMSNNEHARILAAIATHDKRAATAEMCAHLEAVNVEVNALSTRHTIPALSPEKAESAMSRG